MATLRICNFTGIYFCELLHIKQYFLYDVYFILRCICTYIITNFSKIYKKCPFTDIEGTFYKIINRHENKQFFSTNFRSFQISNLFLKWPHQINRYLNIYRF